MTREPCMSSRTVPGRACSTPACRHWPTRLRRQMSPHCATSFRTWSGAPGGGAPPAVAHAAVGAPGAEPRRRFPALPLFAGGRSFGGRMTSQAQAISPLDGVRGLAFVAFPLHPAGAPGVERARHLADVTVPILFLQGTRDKLAELHLLRSVVGTLRARATLHVVDDADHSFPVRAPSGRTDAEVVLELARTMSAWFFAEGEFVPVA